MTERGWEATTLEGIGRSGQRNEWIPIRRELGVTAFGVNAWAGDEGAELVGEHDESTIGHEELYVVVSGHAAFTVDGQDVDAPTGTVVFVRDPSLKRGARATAPDTTILTVGAKPGEPFRVSPWEVNADVLPLFERGEYAEAKRRLEEVLAENPRAGGILYNLACAEARLGDTDAAVEHLRRAVDVEAGFARYAAEDDDLAAIRDDPRFPRP